MPFRRSPPGCGLRGGVRLRLAMHSVASDPRLNALRYSMLALDLDGTLLSTAGTVSPENVAAVARARRAGIEVVVCTGRGLIECRSALDSIEQVSPVVVAGGSIVACPRTSRTLHRFSIDRALVARTVQTLLEHGHPALLLKDPIGAGYDYLVVTGPQPHPLDPVTLWWFATMNVKVRYVERLEEDDHPEHTVRVGACGLSGGLGRMKQELLEEFGDRVTIHSFPCVVAPHMTREVSDGQTLHILEVFDRSATKWSAISYLARAAGIVPERIAAVGDEVNDVPMLEGAGLGVAMGNAVPAVRRVAQRHTLRNDDHGVAHAIDQILSGAW